MIVLGKNNNAVMFYVGTRQVRTEEPIPFRWPTQPTWAVKLFAVWSFWFSFVRKINYTRWSQKVKQCGSAAD